MEPIMTVVLMLAIVVCAYMAWNIGANDVANSCEDAANAFLPIVYN